MTVRPDSSVSNQTVPSTVSSQIPPMEIRNGADPSSPTSAGSVTGTQYSLYSVTCTSSTHVISYGPGRTAAWKASATSGEAKYRGSSSDRPRIAATWAARSTSSGSSG